MDKPPSIRIEGREGDLKVHVVYNDFCVMRYLSIYEAVQSE